MSEQNTNRSIVAEGTVITGKVTSQKPLTVSGKIDGELEAPEVDVTSTGVLSGKVKAERLKSEGELAGSVEAGSLELAGKVRDNTSIKAKTLEVKLASDSDALSLTFGTARVEAGDAPRNKGGNGGKNKGGG